MPQEGAACSDWTQVKDHVADGLILALKPLLKVVVCILTLLYSLQYKYIQVIFFISKQEILLHWGLLSSYIRKQTQKFWKLKVEYTSALPEKKYSI